MHRAGRNDITGHQPHRGPLHHGSPGGIRSKVAGERTQPQHFWPSEKPSFVPNAKSRPCATSSFSAPPTSWSRISRAIPGPSRHPDPGLGRPPPLRRHHPVRDDQPRFSTGPSTGAARLQNFWKVRFALHMAINKGTTASCLTAMHRGPDAGVRGEGNARSSR